MTRPFLTAAAILVFATTVGAQDASAPGQPMTSYADMGPVEGSSAALVRLEHGLYAAVDTSGLSPDDAVTLLWVVFNEPGQCSEPCGGDDIFNMDEAGNIVPSEDGSAPMNMEQIEAAAISLLRADGRVVDENGDVSFRAHLPIGDTTEAAFGPGLLDSEAAEVHLVVRSHGQVQPGLRAEMLNTINGGCAAEWPNEPCRNVQFTIFKTPGA